MTSELLVTGGFRVPNVQKNLFQNNHEREKDPYLQFCSINLVEGKQVRH